MNDPTSFDMRAMGDGVVHGRQFNLNARNIQMAAAALLLLLLLLLKKRFEQLKQFAFFFKIM